MDKLLTNLRPLLPLSKAFGIAVVSFSCVVFVQNDWVVVPDKDKKAPTQRMLSIEPAILAPDPSLYAAWGLNSDLQLSGAEVAQVRSDKLQAGSLTLQLLGVFRQGQQWWGVLSSTENGNAKTVTVQPGQQVAGYQIVSIQHGELTLAMAGHQHILRMFKPEK